ncbi:TPA: hypothetical protein QDC20_007492 [Burkholderia aenigmatica]|nr:hypothetical protein [Burkholderia sp. AU45251]HDR9486032.1 hypothetical protein [Burkholderia aenigmatica]MDN7518753.1 hypothetical protein [Burkholderia sp. AU45251]HDR9517748.1 hypothetical protein [Burkholderia aenigmatica]HDR9595937.1 hypothetical protein [Burkholderia aenigmatica]HDR9602986.1 hypothetical protein [Burkholderia aenigmatica]
MAARVAAAWPPGLAGNGEAVQHDALSRNLKKISQRLSFPATSSVYSAP